MTAYDVEKGDSVHPGKPVTVDRYTGGARINHWITATSLVLLAISGLALFHPSMYFLTGLFGGGQATRAIHPWIGVILFFSFFGLFFRFWRANLWAAEDGTWMARLADVLTAREERLPEVGKYNAGQKIVFWAMSILIVVLISSGLVIWDQYFYPLTSIEQKRVAVVIHAAAAVTIICVWIVHVYAAIWVR
ncbi:MAG: formate dehydrogenase subunit gamma, partial [Pseudolabrys sp.]|nr:formate dehydrogenase subunit gamma [Pseudolabrys sp.]